MTDRVSQTIIGPWPAAFPRPVFRDCRRVGAGAHAHGYQRTQVQDADALPWPRHAVWLRPGQAALFAAVRYGDAQEALPLASELPVHALLRARRSCGVGPTGWRGHRHKRLTHAL